MERNQTQFVRNENGTYNLYCVVAAKAVASMFTKNNDDFIIHYTNLNTRKPDDSPDEFETKALEALHDDPELEAYYELTTDENGNEVFRYIEPLYIQDSCLECHGQPKGELDVMGYPKEGQQLGDIAGAASIIMPAKTYAQNAQANVRNGALVFSLILICGLVVIFWSISHLVTSPVHKLEIAATQVKNHTFKVDLTNVGYRDEIKDLATSFTEMAQQLESLYEGLESEVELRTAQIKESNLILEEQQHRLEEMNIRLQKDNRLKSDFLAMVSHEIRTPLTSILAFADIWERTNTPRNEDEEKIMKEMRSSSQVLLSMVNNMLGMARVEAGKLELNLGSLDVADLLYDIKGNLSFLAEKKKLTFTVSSQRDIPVVISDGEKLRRILENLISNAIKFTDEGGTVAVEVSYDTNNEQLKFVVRDNGCGISDEGLPLIFDRFTRGSSKSNQGGSGLGLALVKEYVELLSGSIEVSSAAGKGSAFTVHTFAKVVDEEDFLRAGKADRENDLNEGDSHENSFS